MSPNLTPINASNEHAVTFLTHHQMIQRDGEAFRLHQSQTMQIIPPRIWPDDNRTGDQEVRVSEKHQLMGQTDLLNCRQTSGAGTDVLSVFTMQKTSRVFPSFSTYQLNTNPLCRSCRMNRAGHSFMRSRSGKWPEEPSCSQQLEMRRFSH